MRREVFECEFCGRHVDPEETPVGWIRFAPDGRRDEIELTANVKLGDDITEGPRVAAIRERQTDFDFCSVDCLAGYLVDAAKAKVGL